MKRPIVGVSVAICHHGRVLMSLRAGGHAAGLWGFGAGGKMEGGESFEDTAKRETKEEIGLILPSVKFWTAANTVYPEEDKHVVVIFTVADMPPWQSIRNLEPDKCVRLEWFKWDRLPEPLMPGVVHLVDCGYNPFTPNYRHD